jgi:hypothetical protein
MMNVTIDYGGNRIRLEMQPQDFAYAIAPLFLVMAGGGRISILEACRPEPEPAS